MGKKRKGLTMTAGMKNTIHWVKTGLKVSTHVFTVAGVVIAASPVIGGVKAATSGKITEAGNTLLIDTTGITPGTTFPLDQAIKTTLVKTVLPVVVGIGLIYGGGVIRKRIGN